MLHVLGLWLPDPRVAECASVQHLFSARGGLGWLTLAAVRLAV